MTYLGAPVVTDTKWTITFLCACRMLKRHYTVFTFLQALPTDTSTIVTTSENFGVWLRATKNLRRNVNKAGKTENIATLGNDLVHFHVALNRR
jgi:hypothetical protein